MKQQGPSKYDMLVQKLAVSLSDVVVLRSLAQGYHWNVKGSDFSERHKFFAKIYEDIDSSIDPLAENILKQGHDSPYMLQDFVSLTNIEPQMRMSGWDRPMLGSLVEANAVTIEGLKDVFDLANECREQGLADFIGGRIDMHQKWQWQLKATLVDKEELEGY
jgi:starvation-inducible DNA-binding protein